MRLKNLTLMAIFAAGLMGCKGYSPKNADDFRYTIDRFADLKVMRYRVPEWDSLNLQQKELLYYLSQAALCGRDMMYDQNFRYNLLIRHTLEAIEQSYKGDRKTSDYEAFTIYLKRVWFSNGIHHHYGGDKFKPGFTEAYFAELLKNSDLSEVLKQNRDGLKTTEDLQNLLTPILFDPALYAKRVNQDPATGLIEGSACNYYLNVSTPEAEKFYAAMANPKDPKPISYGLNSRLEKQNGRLVENVYKVGGLYSEALEQIIYWLDKAEKVAETPQQAAHIRKLIEYYQTGDLRTWDVYNVMWVEDHSTLTDYNNGFIENYGDPLGLKASWEATSQFKNQAATKRAALISQNAQWFEDHSPIDPRFRKKEVKGVSAKVINVVQLGGDCHPTPPIGINLPNADWIRRDHGSKSVTIENLTDAYNKSAEEGKSMMAEFAYDEAEVSRAKAHGALGSNLHTDLHECLGHGSGQLLPGTASDALKSFSSTLEEARADLFALYYIADDKMMELGLVESPEVAKAEYDSYIRNGLMTQLVRIEPGKNIEEAHMRNRSLIAHWVYEKGAKDKVVEMVKKNGKTYVKINDYTKLRALFGELLAEMQRIKSEGDYEAGKRMVETYAIAVDSTLHQEVLARYATLDLAPYGGFVNPALELKTDKDGKVVDVLISYPDDFKAQMLEYGRKFSFLPY